MSIPGQSVFASIEQFSGVLGIDGSMEGRFENDGNGNPIYIGFSPFPNASTAMNIWFIRKIIYDGENVVRTQLPTDGIKFGYSWDARATYFA